MDASSLLAASRLVAVVELQDHRLAVPLAETLLEAGIGTMEITLRTDQALTSIEAIAHHVPAMLTGAGSVRLTERVKQVSEAGARFAVSPGASAELLSAVEKYNLPFVPGALTASEMIVLLEHGYTLQKFFPAELAGGVAWLKALSAPLPEIRFFPTGGITPSVVRQYLAFDRVACIGGSWFAPAHLLAEKDLDGIRRLAREAVKIIDD